MSQGPEPKDLEYDLPLVSAIYSFVFIIRQLKSISVHGSSFILFHFTTLTVSTSYFPSLDVMDLTSLFGRVPCKPDYGLLSFVDRYVPKRPPL